MSRFRDKDVCHGSVTIGADSRDDTAHSRGPYFLRTTVGSLLRSLVSRAVGVRRLDVFVRAGEIGGGVGSRAGAFGHRRLVRRSGHATNVVVGDGGAAGRSGRGTVAMARTDPRGGAVAHLHGP